MRTDIRKQGGFSLVEALLTFAMVGLGIVGAVAMAGALRSHGEDARQRAEAVQIAQAEAEWLRGFSTLAGDGRSYEAIATSARTVDGVDSATAFVVDRRVQALDRHKAVEVTVEWVDRHDDPQSVELDTVVPALDPAVSALLAAPATGRPQPAPLGHLPGLPFPTMDLGDGRSAFKPAAGGGAAWVFDQASGLVTTLCSVAEGSLPTAANLRDCRTVDGRLVAGEVRFDTDGSADAEQPPGPALDLDMALRLSAGASGAQCHDDAPNAQASVHYACLVELLPGAARWTGRLSVVPAGWAWGSDAARFRLCRYCVDDEHPDTYIDVGSNLVHQNFLVIRGDNACPTDGPAHPERGDLVDSSTQQQEPH